MAKFKYLISYFETSLCADQKSYKNHDDPKHLSRVIAFESENTSNGQNLLIFKGCLPFEASLRGHNYRCMHGPYTISCQHAMNFQSVEIRFLE